MFTALRNNNQYVNKMSIFSKSKKHCDDAKETYLQHMKIAIKISFGLLKASLMALIHSLIPALFEKGASNKIISLYKYLQDKKRVKNEN